MSISPQCLEALEFSILEAPNGLQQVERSPANGLRARKLRPGTNVICLFVTATRYFL